MPLRVVVVSHDATLTGAPMSALRLWRAAKETHGADVAFVVLGEGPLLPEFTQTARTLVYRPVLPTRLGERPALKSVLQRRFLGRALRTLRPFDAVVMNTGTLGHLMETVRATGMPVVTHVHEMRHWLTNRVTPSNLRQTCALSDAVIACSEATRRDLVELGFDAARISVVREPLPSETSPPGDGRARLRQMLGIRPDALVVAAAGTADRRKGVDLFLELGILLQELCERPICMPWFGHLLEPDRAWLEHDGRLAASGVRFVGPIDNLAELMPGVDVFCLTSREDPFPLVMLEAAASGVPVAAFHGSGGADELLADGVGLLSPYLDLVEMARGVARLLGDPAAAQEMGRRGRAATADLTPDRLAADALDVVRRVIAQEPARGG